METSVGLLQTVRPCCRPNDVPSSLASSGLAVVKLGKIRSGGPGALRVQHNGHESTPGSRDKSSSATRKRQHDHQITADISAQQPPSHRHRYSHHNRCHISLPAQRPSLPRSRQHHFEPSSRPVQPPRLRCADDLRDHRRNTVMSRQPRGPPPQPSIWTV